MPAGFRLPVSRSRTLRVALMGLAGLAAMFIGHPIQAQVPPRLELSVELAKHELALGDEVAMLVVLRNPLPQRVVLRGDPGFSAGGGLVVTATDAAGRRFVLSPEPGFISEDEVRSGDSKVVLAADEGLGLGHRFAAQKLFPRAGFYSLVVEYQSPHPSEGNRSVVSGEAEGAHATSTALTIEVRQ